MLWQQFRTLKRNEEEEVSTFEKTSQILVGWWRSFSRYRKKLLSLNSKICITRLEGATHEK